MTLQTAPKVFSPLGIDKGTEILINNLILPPQGMKDEEISSNPECNILDLGAGYGPISIWLYKHYFMEYQLNKDVHSIPNIYASEINDRAVWLLKRNKISNG